MNQHLQKLYKSDIQLSKLVKVFAFLTILISALELYGLITLVSEKRLKEISLRKVFGAPFSHLILTLSRSFMILIIIANIIAWPFSYWMAISGITLFVQSRKVAIISPAKILKHE